MNDRSFDSLTRAFESGSSRRTAITRLAGGALAALMMRFGAGGAAEARKKNRKNKKPKLKLNAFGCVDVGKPCRGNDANCCSGICQGKKPKKGKKDTSRCVAHNTGGCQADQDFCAGVVVACGTGGTCSRTTGNASFCGDGGGCVACKKDADCEAEFGLGAACIVCAECESDIGSPTACFPPVPA